MEFKELEKVVEDFLQEGENLSKIPKIENRGDVAEGLLGAALVARFLKGKETSGVSTEDIEKVLDDLNAGASIPIMKKSGKVAKGKVKKTWNSGPIKRDNGTEDQIEFTVALNEAAFFSLVDPVRRPRLQGVAQNEKVGGKIKKVKQPNLYTAVAKYANSAPVIKAAMDEQWDTISSVVKIISDGVSDQKGTKVDLLVYKDDKKLARLGSLSLKALGTKQLGQLGKGWRGAEGKSRGIYDLMVALFGITLPEDLSEQYILAMTEV